MVKFLHLPSSILKYREKSLKLVNVYYSIVSNVASFPIPPVNVEESIALVQG
jgi:hypothetical protein